MSREAEGRPEASRPVWAEGSGAGAPRNRPPPWLIALPGALALHLALMLALNARWSHPEVQPASGQGLKILLERRLPAALAPAVPEPEGAPRPEARDPAEAKVPESAPPRAVALPVEIDQTAEASVAPEPAPPIVAPIPKTPVPETKTAAAPPPPLAQPTRPKKTASQKAAAQPARRPSRPRPTRSAAVKRPPAKPTVIPRGGRREAGRAAVPDAAPAPASDAAAHREYARQIAAWINRHKRYPRRAQRLGQQGTTKVRFTIDPQGHVRSCRIVQSSGHALLDREVEELLRRADPLPAIPTALARTELTLTVPIRFSLRQR